MCFRVNKEAEDFASFGFVEEGGREERFLNCIEC